MNIKTYPKFIGVSYDIEINNTPVIPMSKHKWGFDYIWLRTKVNLFTVMQENNMHVKKIKTIDNKFIPCEYHYNN